MICPCGHENRPGRRYCGQCGGFLFAPCGRCAFENFADERFCGGCGDALGEERHGAGRPARRPQAPVPAPAAVARPALAPAAVARPAPAVAAAVAPAAPPAVAKPAVGRDDALSATELTELLRGSDPATKPQPQAQPPSLPEGAITQDALDRLFGA